MNFDEGPFNLVKNLFFFHFCQKLVHFDFFQKSIVLNFKEVLININFPLKNDLFLWEIFLFSFCLKIDPLWYSLLVTSTKSLFGTKFLIVTSFFALALNLSSLLTKKYSFPLVGDRSQEGFQYNILPMTSQYLTLALSIYFSHIELKIFVFYPSINLPLNSSLTLPRVAINKSINILQLQQLIVDMKDIYTKARICPFRSPLSSTCEIGLEPGKFD